MLSIIITLFAVGVVIFVHELGHMLAAKRAGIGVYEFSVGMGPKLLSKKFKETIYSLRAFPFGGFVKLAGLDEDEEGKKSEAADSFNSKSILARSITISAGSLVNIFFGFLIFFGIYLFLGIPHTTNQIMKIMPDSPAQRVGLQVGDTVVALNGQKVKEVQSDFIKSINQNEGKELELTILRQKENQIIKVIPQKIGKAKVATIGIYFDVKYDRVNIFKIFYYSLVETKDTIKSVFVSLGMLFSGQAALSDVAGPIGIIQIVSFQLSRGVLYFLNIMALISISLGVINLFPFPVLDGGYIALLLYELISRKAVNKNVEDIMNKAGMAVLVTLMVLVVINDCVNWGHRVEILKGFLK
jgi:regulator of sigma E protease